MSTDDKSPASKAELKVLLDELEGRLMRHVDVRFEDLRKDWFDAMSLKFALHDDRFDRLEAKVFRGR